MIKKLTWFIAVLAFICLCALNYAEYFILHALSDGLKSPDFRPFGYSYDEFAVWQTRLGDQGTALYLKWFSNGFDKFFPALLGLLIALVMHGVLNRFPKYQARSSLLKLLVPAIFALPYVFFDYFENLVVADAISAKGNAGSSMIAFASSLTVLKFSFLAIALVAIFVFWMASLKQNKAQST